MPLFPGENESEQLACIMEIIGLPPPHMIASASRRRVFFGGGGGGGGIPPSSGRISVLFLLEPGRQGLNLLNVLCSCADSQSNPRQVTNSKGRKRIVGSRDLATAVKTSDPAFVDFLVGTLQWDPSKRFTPEEALKHEFLSGSSSSNPTSVKTRSPQDPFSIMMTTTTSSNSSSDGHQHGNMSSTHHHQSNGNGFGNGTSNANNTTASYSSGSRATKLSHRFSFCVNDRRPMTDFAAERGSLSVRRHSRVIETEPAIC
ncbi:unnamed protein product [Notodromas monacha]|uniref:Uncharacterized protein n=1 Tax=Notodromas monacha TaxID=399045 RepID=A0A7R9C0A6_9CRUS|nr:unnamed protein product [Notodromas monacha]CAG0925083.1 unnamed protein product [Notodromas monacha]